jgi:hypothetical protein
MALLSVPYVTFADWRFDAIDGKETESKRFQWTWLSWRFYRVSRNICFFVLSNCGGTSHVDERTRRRRRVVSNL